MMSTFILLPATCVALVDKMTDQQINTEFVRLKEADPSNSNTSSNGTPLSSINTPTVTRSKVSLSRKREAIKTALLNSISTNCIKQLSLEKEILSSLKDIKESATPCTRSKDAATNTDLITHSVATTTEITTHTKSAMSTADAATSMVPPGSYIPSVNCPTTSQAPPRDTAPTASTAPAVSTVTSAPTKPPPFGLPGTLTNPKRDILLGKSSCRKLFLTDSILRAIDPSSLRTRKDEISVKKTMYYISDIGNYEPEFSLTDTVIISSGINDLTRKRLLPEQICDIIVPQFRKYSYLYPNTKFVVNSVIMSSFWKLNNFIRRLNNLIADSIKGLANFYYFDSHNFLCRFRDPVIYTDKFGVKIHISYRAVTYIKGHLMTFLQSTSNYGCRNYRTPLRMSQHQT